MRPSSLPIPAEEHHRAVNIGFDPRYNVQAKFDLHSMPQLATVRAATSTPSGCSHGTAQESTEGAVRCPNACESPTE